MKKIIFLAAATMLWGCGPRGEAQDIQEQEQLGQQESALDYNRAPIIGKWYWVGGADYKADVRIDGTGYQISGDCFNGTPVLVCAPELAFNDSGLGDVVPPGAAVVFELELLEIVSQGGRLLCATCTIPRGQDCILREERTGNKARGKQTHRQCKTHHP